MALLVAEDDATRMMRKHRVRVTVKENYKYQKLSLMEQLEMLFHLSG